MSWNFPDNSRGIKGQKAGERGKEPDVGELSEKISSKELEKNENVGLFF